jgi:hypothetical protein
MDAESIRTAYEALAERNVEPFVALLDDELEWRGRRSGWRIWRPQPS